MADPIPTLPTVDWYEKLLTPTVTVTAPTDSDLSIRALVSPYIKLIPTAGLFARFVVAMLPLFDQEIAVSSIDYSMNRKPENRILIRDGFSRIYDFGLN